jgi:phosphogluconate dehydratase
MVGLLATGGSTNHTIHLIAIAKAAGIIITWDDFSALSAIVPLITKIYPNGQADINHFQAAGGMGYLIHELLQSGLVHNDVLGVADGKGLEAYLVEPSLDDNAELTWKKAQTRSLAPDVLTTTVNPFHQDGGLRALSGNLGRAVVKTSAVETSRYIVEAPAKIFNSQQELQAAFKRDELNEDFIAVVRFQGPRANGMPELHKLTPLLGVLQDRGYRVALVTDGRMSGASGKVPAAIHVTPECASGGPLAKVQDGDIFRLDAVKGTLQALVGDDEFARRSVAVADLSSNEEGMGRELFSAMRQQVGCAEEGASCFSVTNG